MSKARAEEEQVLIPKYEKKCFQNLNDERALVGGQVDLTLLTPTCPFGSNFAIYLLITRKEFS